MLFHALSFFIFYLFILLIIDSTVCVSTSVLPGNITDHSALLSIKARIVSDPSEFTSSWNESTPFCNWEGITCSHRHQKVVRLDLHSLGLVGSLSPSIGNLSFLRELLLYNNSFTGNIPEELGQLTRLQRLRFRNNSFSGAIPKNISRCRNLIGLHLGGNNLVGGIPIEFQSLSRLELLYIQKNKLTGRIPPQIANISSLTEIVLLENNFDGEIPSTFGRLQHLTDLLLGQNNLSGAIPTSIFNMSSLVNIDLPVNQLQGHIPSDMGFGLPRLETFNVAGNQLTGQLPSSISNATELVFLAFGANRFTGNVPSFEGLKKLQRLGLQRNQLGYGKYDDFRFMSSLQNCTQLLALHLSENRLGGMLPRLIGNFSNLMRLNLERNLLSGNIPSDLGNLFKLEALRLASNLFNGSVPDSIGKLQRLRILILNDNRLSGNIPSSLGNLSLLTQLYAGKNKLHGRVPSSLGNCKSLLLLDFSQNNLSGHIPREIFGLSSLSVFLDLSNNLLMGSLPLDTSQLNNLAILNLANNRLSGEIPRSLGTLTSLRELQMANNHFHGTISQFLISLRSLESVDLSGNNLTGQIPEFLGSFIFLKKINLSYNDFEGEVPTEGIFKFASEISVYGNNKLCGGVPGLLLPKCPRKDNPKFSRRLILIISVSSGFLVLLSAVISVFIYHNNHTVAANITTGVVCLDRSTGDMIPKVSYRSLYKTTSGFSAKYLIGSGKFSSVYKGMLDKSGSVVAVKVFKLQIQGALSSFNAECEALRHIRHRNLVKILTTCSGIDFQGNDFKAIIYDYKVNGSLEDWLHPHSLVATDNQELRNLTLLQRVNVAIDVASALDYLHHNCGAPLVHCDLKPSNILLDGDLAAHVADFGLARFLPQVADQLSTIQNNSLEIKGTIGYAAPEYGMGSELSTYGDIYSYGILLLEMFTGKCPTNAMFNNGLNLHTFVKTAIAKHVIMEISDPRLFHNQEVASSSFQAEIHLSVDQIREYLTRVYRIGVHCSVESPRERMDISNVITELNSIRDTLLKAPAQQEQGATVQGLERIL